MQKEVKVKFHDMIRKPEYEVETLWEGLRGYMWEGPDGSQVIFWECDTEVTSTPQKHDEEWCVVVEGVCRLRVEGEKERILTKGDENIIAAGKSHWATMGPGYRAVDYFASPHCKYKNKK